MKKRNKFVMLIFVLFAFLGMAISTGFAWLTGNKYIDCELVSGSILTKYFEKGVGTSDSPFVITRPIHYSNLVMLYQGLEDFAENYLYFQIGCNLDESDDDSVEVYAYDDNGKATGGYSDTLNMGGYSGDYALLPIGTASKPFYASFNGNNLTVTNLNIKATGSIGETTYGTCDIGIFGYVSGDSSIQNVYYDNFTIDLRDLDIEHLSSNTEIDHSSTVHVVRDETVAYVGYIAGHIATTTACENIYINNAKIIGGDKAINGFGYFGCVEDLSTHNPITSLGQRVGTLREAGEGSGFGGSIKMNDLYQRVHDVRQSYGTISQYPSAQIIKINENRDGEVVALQPTLSTPSSNAFKYYSSENAGKYFIFDRGALESSDGYNAYTYISGIGDGLLVKTVTTYTYYDDLDALFITDGNNHFLKASTTAISNVNASNNSDETMKWIFDDDNHLYVIIDGIKYYLNRNNDYSLTIGTNSANATVWEKTNSNQIRYFYNNNYYYLYYNTSEASGWATTTETTSYRLYSDNNYLSASTTSVTNSNEAGSVRWFFTNDNAAITSGQATDIYTIFSGTKYYLYINNDNLTVSASNRTSFTKDGDYYYTTNAQSDKCYITYDGGWKLVVKDGYRISDNTNTHYISINGNNIVDTNIDSSSLWVLGSPNGSTSTIYTYDNNTPRYLSVSGTDLALSNSSYNWNLNNGSIYTTISGTDYYLMYDNGWSIYPLIYYVIGDGSGHFIGLSNSNNVTNVSEENATHFTFSNNGNNPSGYIYTRKNGTNYYLYVNNKTLSTTTDTSLRTSWSNDNSKISYTDSVGLVNYICYDNTDGWSLTNNGYVISDNKGNYLQVTGTGTTNYARVTSIDDATRFAFSSTGANPSGYISTEYNGTIVYLRNNNNAFQLTTTEANRTSWTNDGNNISNNNYYLLYNGSSWMLSSSKSLYTISNGNGSYLKVTGINTGDFTYTNVADDATLFVFSTTGTNPSGTIQCTIDGNNRYLRNNNGTLQISTTTTTWSNDGTSIYNGNYYLKFNGSAWSLTYGKYVITDGDGNYLRVTGTNANNYTNTTDVTQATTFVFSTDGDNPSGTIQCNYNGTNRYIRNYNNGTLQVSGTSTTWSNDGISIYNGNYYLIFNGTSWALSTNREKGYYITDGSGNYLRVTGTGTNNYTNTTDETQATLFNFSNTDENPSGTIQCTINNSTRYLRNNNGTLEVSTTQTTWSNSGNNIYNGTYALYFDGTWKLYQSTTFVITDGSGNYLRVTGTGTNNYTNTTDATQATSFTFSNAGANPSGTIRCTINNSTRYLRNNNGTLEVSTTQTTWSNDGTSIYNGSYYLTFNNSWKLETQNIRYRITDGSGNYLRVTGTSSFANTTDATQATWFTFSNTGTNPSGRISAVYNGTTVYLASGNTLAVTNRSSSAGTFNNNNGVLTTSNGRYIRYNNGWSINRYYSTTLQFPQAYELSDGTIVYSFDATTNPYVDNSIGNSRSIGSYYNSHSRIEDASVSTTENILSTIVNTINATQTLVLSSNSNPAPTINRTAGSISIHFNLRTINETYALSNISTTQRDYKKEIEENVPSGMDTYFPLKIINSGEEGYSAQDPYAVSGDNTGYIVGGGYYHQANGDFTSDIRISQYAIANVNKSITNVYITDGNNHYLRITGTSSTSFSSSAKANASSFVVENNYNARIYATYNNTKVYLYVTGGNFRLTTYQNYSYWHFDGTNLYYKNGNTTYYLYYNGTTFAVSTTKNANNKSLIELTFSNIRTINNSGIQNADTVYTNNEAYDIAKENLTEMLTSGGLFVYGLHFMDSLISADRLSVADKVTILGKTYYDYELPRDSVDFNVYERGFVSFAAGSYFDGNNTFFSLHEILRDSDKKITDIKEIYKVYMNDQYGALKAYIYEYTDGTYKNANGQIVDSCDLTGYSMVFDTAWISTGVSSYMNDADNYIYFFQIPVNSGEYALGSVENKDGAYLIYLDIAANGGNVLKSFIDSSGTDIVNSFDKVDFRDYDDTVIRSILQFEITTPANASEELFSVTVSFTKGTEENPLPYQYEKGLYTITIVNKCFEYDDENSSYDAEVVVLLCDDNDDATDDFKYAYRIVYTNLEYTNETYLTITDDDYFQTSTGFVIHPVGLAEEKAF